jgi:sugar phosphate isomerase/epimerase
VATGTTGSEKSRLGVIHYNWPGYEFEAFVQRAVEIGYRYCELDTPDFWDDARHDGGEASALAARKILDRHGLSVSAIAPRNDFLQADPDDLTAQLSRYRQICQLAPILGTDLLRTDGGWNRAGLVPTEQWDAMLEEAFKRCADIAEETQIRIALDNHGLATNDGEWQLDLIKRVGSPRFGVNLDTMNYRWFGHDLSRVDHFYEILAPHVFHVHLKDGVGSRDSYRGRVLGEGEIHLDHAFNCLEAYDGVWTAEYEGDETAQGEGYARCYQWMAANL